VIAAPRLREPLPDVTDADVFDDAQWVGDHPDRQYRLRPGWAVRRRSGVFLRAPLAGGCTDPDHERRAEFLSWRSPWPEPVETRNEPMEAARPRKPRPGEKPR
jgi:hypothetical protein